MELRKEGEKEGRERGRKARKVRREEGKKEKTSTNSNIAAYVDLHQHFEWVSQQMACEYS